MPEPTAPYDAGDAPTSRTYRPVPSYADRIVARDYAKLDAGSYEGCDSCTSGTITLPIRMFDNLNRRIAELERDRAALGGLAHPAVTPATVAAEPPTDRPEGNREGAATVEAHKASEVVDADVEMVARTLMRQSLPPHIAPTDVARSDARAVLAALAAAGRLTPTGIQPDRVTEVALAAARTALQHAEQTCRYHGTDFARLGWEFGEPRCDSCKQPWRVTRALDALAVAEREG